MSTSSRLAATAMVVSTPFVAFWLIGDQSVSDDAADNDYLVRMSIGSRTVMVVGLVATVVLVLAATYLFRHRTDPPDTRAAQLVGLLMLAGVLLAAGGRTVTAGVIGANIGGGLFIMIGLPLCAALVAFAVVRHRRSGRAAL